MQNVKIKLMGSLKSKDVELAMLADLNLHCTDEYRGLKVDLSKGDLIEEYLRLLHGVIYGAVMHKTKLYTVKVRLKVPLGVSHEDQQLILIEWFADELGKRLRQGHADAKKFRGKHYGPYISCFWVREVNGRGEIYYDVLLLFNDNVYFRAGGLPASIGWMRNHIELCWRNILEEICYVETHHVRLPDNPQSVVTLKDGAAALFYQASRMCRARKKQFDISIANIGAHKNC